MIYHTILIWPHTFVYHTFVRLRYHIFEPLNGADFRIWLFDTDALSNLHRFVFQLVLPVVALFVFVVAIHLLTSRFMYTSPMVAAVSINML